MDDPTLMDELYRLNKLPENAKSLYRGEWPFAERFPVLHVVGSFLHENKNSVLFFGGIQEKVVRVETKQVWMLELVECFGHLNCFLFHIRLLA